MNDLKPEDEKRENELKPKVCPRCDYINSPLSRFCGRCGTVPDEEEPIGLNRRAKK